MPVLGSSTIEDLPFSQAWGIPSDNDAWRCLAFSPTLTRRTVININATCSSLDVREALDLDALDDDHGVCKLPLIWILFHLFPQQPLTHGDVHHRRRSTETPASSSRRHQDPTRWLAPDQPSTIHEILTSSIVAHRPKEVSFYVLRR